MIKIFFSALLFGVVVQLAFIGVVVVLLTVPLVILESLKWMFL